MVLARFAGAVKLIRLAEYLPYWRSCGPSKLNQRASTEHIPSLLDSIFLGIMTIMRARGSVVVKALCYKLEGRGFETR
jgi:hypothetical protein